MGWIKKTLENAEHAHFLHTVFDWIVEFLGLRSLWILVLSSAGTFLVSVVAWFRDANIATVLLIGLVGFALIAIGLNQIHLVFSRFSAKKGMPVSDEKKLPSKDASAAREITVRNGGIGSTIKNDGDGIGLDIEHTGSGAAERITVEGHGVGEIIENTGRGIGKKICYR